MSTGTSWQGSSRELLHACLAFNGSLALLLPHKMRGQQLVGVC